MHSCHGPSMFLSFPEVVLPEGSIDLKFLTSKLHFASLLEMLILERISLCVTSTIYQAKP